MIIRDVNLETVCGVTSKLPENTLPEFAFAGKSNVGKSSLINALMNRKAYAPPPQPGECRGKRERRGVNIGEGRHRGPTQRATRGRRSISVNVVLQLRERKCVEFVIFDRFKV